MYLTLRDINETICFLCDELQFDANPDRWSFQDVLADDGLNLGWRDNALVTFFRGEFEYPFLVRRIDNQDSDRANDWAKRNASIVDSDSESTLWILTAAGQPITFYLASEAQ